MPTTEIVTAHQSPPPVARKRPAEVRVIDAVVVLAERRLGVVVPASFTKPAAVCGAIGLVFAAPTALAPINQLLALLFAMGTFAFWLRAVVLLGRNH